MRVDLIILFASCALAASSSNASNVRRNPIPSAIVQSVAESQQGLPVNRLLRGHETIINEERAPNLKNLLRSKASIWSELPGEEVLKPFLTKENGTPATALEVFQHKDFSILAKVFRKKPDVSLMAMLSGERGDKDVTMTLYQLKKSGSLDDEVAVELMNEQFSYLHLKANRDARLVFDTVLKTNDPKDPISMFNGEVEVLENYLRWRNGRRDVADELIRTMAVSLGHPRFVSMVSTHYKNPEAQLLEKKLYKLLFEDEHERMRQARERERMRQARKPEMMRLASQRERMRRAGESGKRYFENLPSGTNVVNGLFRFGKMKDMGVKLLHNHDVLNMMGRFYLKSPGSQIIPDVTATVKALKEAFGKYPAALLISKAVEKEDPAIESVVKELEIEYFKQEELSPDNFQLVALDRADESDHDTIRKFIERYREFERKELNGGEGGLVAST